MAKTTENTTEVQMTPEETKANVRMYEDDILGGLMAAAAYKTDMDEVATIQIIRHKAIVLEFRIRPMAEDEMAKIKKKNTIYKRNKANGLRVAESVNSADYRSELIYEATIEEDRAKIWDRADAWEKCSVVNGIGLVDVVLKAGEKDAILEKLDEISGFTPSMEEVDESTERRGQLSVNAIFNNKVAVLAGDYLLATALVQVGMTRNHDIIDIVSCLGQDLADGELLQLSNVSNLHFSEEVYFDVIRKKTAVLFAACTKAGALSVGASDEKAESARLFGEYIGLCFQIKDDIFDYSESKEIGKPTGNDMVEGKLTLPALHVLNTVKDKTAEEIAVKIKNGEATPGEIAHLIEFTKQNGGIEYASQVMYDYKEKALSLLASLPDTEVKVALAGYLDYVVEREK